MSSVSSVADIFTIKDGSLYYKTIRGKGKLLILICINLSERPFSYQRKVWGDHLNRWAAINTFNVTILLRPVAGYIDALVCKGECKLEPLCVNCVIQSMSIL